jgi:adenine-specific DNA-methyltransferase
VERAAQPGLPEAEVRCGEAIRIEGEFDLVYMDPPYLPAQGAAVDYGAFYHFLEGLLDHSGWAARIDRSRRHRPYRMPASPWGDRQQAPRLLAQLIERFSQATLAISYRSDGIPDPQQIRALLRRCKRKVTVHDAGSCRYVLSTRSHGHELLFVGE